MAKRFQFISFALSGWQGCDSCSFDCAIGASCWINELYLKDKAAYVRRLSYLYHFCFHSDYTWRNSVLVSYSFRQKRSHRRQITEMFLVTK